MYAIYSESIETPQSDDLLGLRTLYSSVSMFVDGGNQTFTGNQGGDFSPNLAWYRISASGCQNPITDPCSFNFQVTGKPDWLDMSPTSGGIGGTGYTEVDFFVNATGKAKPPGTYGPVTITITNTSTGRGNTTRTVTLIVGGGGLGAPTATSATNITSTTFQANWTSVSGATGYRIDVAYDQNFTSLGLNNYDAGNSTGLTVTGVSPSTTYWYRVRAYNATTTSGNSNTISVTTSSAGSPPPAPTANAASSVTSSAFTANWSSSSGATGYRLDVSTSSGFGSFVSGYNNLDVGNAQTASVTGLSASTTYYYRVRAYNGNGTSGNSNVITVTTTSSGGGPANDNFANAIAIQAGQTTLSGSNVGATKESGEPNLSYSPGGKSVWWNCTAAGAGSATVDTIGSSFDTILGIFTGTAVNALALIAENDDFGGNLTSSVTFPATANTTYRIMVDGYGGASGNITMHLTNLSCGGPTGKVAHDFNGDGKSDIAWRDSGGTAAVWLMNGAQVSQSGGFGVVPTTWSIVGQLDFNGDGKHDLLWRDSSGNTAIWFMNGLQVSSTGSVGNVPTTWTVVGAADFDGDGKGDILWHSSTGVTAIWLMNGTQVSFSASIGTIPTTWSVVATADFNGDGKDDILWRDTSGNTAIWFLNGTSVSSSAGLGVVPTTWTVVGTGDFDGNGKSDILWRDSSGNTAIWFMNGAAISSTAGIGVVPTSWSIVETGDFNGDGKSDIVWRDTSGNTAIWFMNSAAISSTAGLGVIPTSWTIQGTNVD
jgi:hypothetical protein